MNLTDFPPVGERERDSPMDDGPPTWREVQEAVHCARAASAPGPTGSLKERRMF